MALKSDRDREKSTTAKRASGGPTASGHKASAKPGGHVKVVMPGGLVPVVAVVAGAFGFMLLPSIPDFPSGLVPIFLFRGLVAGCVAGLLLGRPAPTWLSPTIAAAAAVVGSLVLAAASAPSSAAAVLVAIIGAAGGATLLGYLAPFGRGIPAQALAVTLLVFVLLWFAGLMPGPLRTQAYSSRQAQLATHPQPEQYGFDGYIFLRTHDLMKQGQGFYQAFREAVAGDSRLDENSLSSPFNYREPFLFYLWKVLPGSNGAAIWFWFVVLSAATLIGSYVLASTFTSPGVALLAPTALVSYFFFFFWVGTWYDFTEVWAGAFGVLAFMCLARKWDIPGLVLLTMAVATREFMLMFVAAWVLAWWFRPQRWRRWWFAAAAVLAPLGVLAAHYIALPPTSGGLGSFTSWLHGDVSRLLAALRFGYSSTPLPNALPVLLVAAALIGAALMRPRWRMVAFLAATVLPVAFLTVVSLSEWAYYWGPFFTPLAVALAPGAFGRLSPPVAGEA